LPVAIWTKTIPQSKTKQINEIATTRPRSSPAFARCARSRRWAARFFSWISIGSMIKPSTGAENAR